MWIHDFLNSLINKYISTYVEQLDAKDIYFSILKGNLELKDLKVKKNILNFINLPLSLVDGRINSLSIKYIGNNWYSFQASIKGLNLVVELAQADSYERFLERYLFNQQSLLQLLLEQAEFMEKIKTNANEIPASQESQSSGYVETVLRNLSICIEDITITLMDKDRKNSPYNFTLHLDRFCVDTTDANWIKTVIRQKSDFLYKIAELTNFSILYKDCSEQNLKLNEQANSTPKLLDPIDVIIKITINDSPKPKPDAAHYNAEIILSSFCINFDVLHYHNIMDLYDKINDLHGIKPEIFFSDSIRFFNPKHKWQYFTSKILNQPWPKWYKISLHLKSLQKFKDEYRELIITKFDPNKNLSTEQTKRLATLETLIPVPMMYEINIKIKEEFKATKGQTTYVGYFSRMLSVNYTPPTSSTANKSEKTTDPPKLPVEVEKLGASNFSIEVHGNLKAFKVAIYSENMRKSLLCIEVGKLNYYFHYKPEFENNLKIEYSIFDLMIVGYDKSETLYIINTNLQPKTEDFQFLSICYTNTQISECNKNQISLKLMDSNVSIYLNFFTHIRQLFNRVSLPSVNDITNYAGEKITDFSQYIIQLIKSSHKELGLDITLNKTSLIFPSANDYVMVARFDRLYFKTYISDKEITFLPFIDDRLSKFKLHLVYLSIDNFNIMCTTTPIFKLMYKDEKFHKMFLKQSILYPVSIFIIFLANKDDSGINQFCYSTYINIPELKIKLSFDQIQILNKIFNDTMLLISSPNEQNEDLLPSPQQPPNSNSWNSYRKKDKILNIILNIRKISLGIRWNSISFFHKKSFDNFMSEILLEIKNINGEYEICSKEDKLKLNAQSLVISHQIDDWIHIIFRASNGLSFENRIILDQNSGKGVILPKKDFKIHQDVFELNLHYHSMQNLVKFAEILISIMSARNSPTTTDTNTTVSQESTDEFNLEFSSRKINICLIFQHENLFTMEILDLIGNHLYIENKSKFSISFMKLILKYNEKPENLFSNLVEIPDKSTINFFIEKTESGKSDMYTYTFEAVYHNAKCNIIYQSIETLRIWSSCLNEGNTAINQARKMVYDTANTITAARDIRKEIVVNIKIEKSHICLPVKSRFPGGVYIDLNDLMGVFKMNIGTDPQIYDFKLILKNNFIQRFLLKDGEFLTQKLLTADVIQADILINRDSISNTMEPIKINISTPDIIGYVLPEDFVMLKQCLVENLYECSDLNDDQNYTFFQIFWGRLNKNTKSDDKDFLQLNFTTNFIKIKLLYNDDEIKKNYYESLETHEGHPDLMELTFSDMKVDFLYRSYMKNVKMSVGSLCINNLISLNEEIRNSSENIDPSKYRFLLSKSITFEYESMEKESTITVVLAESACELDLNMIGWIRTHILPIFWDYTIYSVKNAKSSENSNFFKVAFSDEFKLNRYESKYYFLMNIYLKNTNLSYRPQIPASLNQRFSSKLSTNFSYEIKNGICKYKIVIPDFPIDFVTESPHDPPISRNFITFDTTYIQFCYTSEFLSYFNIVINNVKCHISYKVLKLITDIKNKHASKKENIVNLSAVSLMESCDNINQFNLFQPHSLSTYSRQLEIDYNVSTIHVDQDVFARHNDGYYYEAKIVMKFSSHLIVNITNLNLDSEISTMDRLAVIPVAACSQRNILVYDFVLFKHKEESKYRLGQVFEILPNKMIIRSYINYNLESTDPEYIFKFPKDFLTHYRGIGLSVFCRLNDGIYYPAIITKRRSFQLECIGFTSEKKNFVINHKILDDSSCALMWDRYDPKRSLKTGDNVLIVSRTNYSYFGVVSRFCCEQNGMFLVKSFLDQKIKIVKPSDCIYMKPQVYGIRGVGSRYLSVNRDSIIPVIKQKAEDSNDTYINASSNTKFSVEQGENFFVDAQANSKILYPFQPVLIDKTGNESILLGNILTINNDKTYTVILPDGSCRNFYINDILIKNPDVHVVKYVPISMVEQEGNLSISNFKIFLVAEMCTQHKPMFLFDATVSLKMYSWSKFQTRLEIGIDLSGSYLNTQQLYWEPFIQFLPIATNKYNRNMIIKYTESSLAECSFLPEIEDIVGSTPSDFKFYILDEINLTISEHFFHSYRILYDDIFKTSLDEEINFFQSQFIFDNQTDIEMEIILTPESKYDKRIILLKAHEKIEFTSNTINYYDIIGNQNIFTPCMFQKIPNTSTKIFKNFTKSNSTHYYFEQNSKIYSYIIDIKINSRIYNIEFRYPFKIVNLIECPIVARFQSKVPLKHVVKVNSMQNKSIFLNYPGDFDCSISLFEDQISRFLEMKFTDAKLPIKYKYTLKKDDNTRFQCVIFLDYEDINTFSSFTLKNSYRPMVIVISPSITIKNDLAYQLSILMLFEKKEYRYNIQTGQSQDIFQLTEMKGRFLINFSFNLLNMVWEASKCFDLSAKPENISLPFKTTSNSLGPIGLNVDKSFSQNFLIRISSFYTFINQTKHDIAIHLVKKNLSRDDVIIVPGNSTLPFSPSHDCEKGNITIDHSLKSETFPLNVIGFQTYLSMKENQKSNLYHNIMVSITRMNNYSIAIELKSAVYFKNNLNQFIQIIPKNFETVDSIYLEKNADAFAVLPLPLFPCDFVIYLDDHHNKYPIIYPTIIEKCTILFSPLHGQYFSGKCFWKNNVLNIEFDELKPNSFDYVLINFSKLTIYCHHEYKTSCLSPNQQVFFSKKNSNDVSISTRFNFHPIIDQSHPVIDFEKLEEKVSEISANNSKLYIAKIYDVMHTAFVFTENRNFALHCSDTISESTWLSLYLKIAGFSLSILSNLLSKEILLFSIFRNCDRWTKIGTDLSHSLFSSRECREFDDLYLKYVFGNISSLNEVGFKKQVDFKEMLYLDDKKTFKLKVDPSFAGTFLLNISVSSELQNLSLKLDKIQIDCPSFDAANPVIICQTPKSASVEIPDSSDLNFIEASIFINRPINYQALGKRKYQNLEYFRCMIQEFEICIDIPLVLTLTNFIDYIIYILNHNQVENSRNNPEINEDLAKYFVKFFHLPPLKFNVNISSASMNDKVSRIEIPDSANKFTYFNSINHILSNIPIMDISRTSINLPCLNIENFEFLLTRSEIIEKSQSHYYSHIKKKVIKLLFNVKLTGNLVSSASHFAEGMKSFFYEPYQGAVRSNQFGKGVMLGVRSLYSGTIGTAADALTSISDSIGKGLATLSFDAEHEDQRNKIMRLREENPMAGLAASGLGVFKGIGSGFMGLVTSPVEAFKEKNEVSDIFKGVGKGIAGLITKPIGGIVDFTSTGFHLISRSSDPDRYVKPRRKERCFYFDGVIRPIDYVEIQKYFIFIILKKNHRFIGEDKFVWAELGINYIHLITDRHLLSATYDSLLETQLIYFKHITSPSKYEVSGRTIKFYETNLNFPSSSGNKQKIFPFVFSSDESLKHFMEQLSRFECP